MPITGLAIKSKGKRMENKKPGRKLLVNATDEDIKKVAAKKGLEFSDEDCEELRKNPLSFCWGCNGRETVAAALDDFIRAYEG